MSGGGHIDVYCDDGRHPDDVAEIGSLIRSGGDVRPVWMAIISRQGHRRHRSREGITQWLDGRPHHEFRCPLCTRTPRLRDEDLQKFATGLDAAGVPRVSLATLEAFAAKVRRK